MKTEAVLQKQSLYIDFAYKGFGSTYFCIQKNKNKEIYNRQRQTKSVSKL